MIIKIFLSYIVIFFKKMYVLDDLLFVKDDSRFMYIVFLFFVGYLLYSFKVDVY